MVAMRVVWYMVTVPCEITCRVWDSSNFPNKEQRTIAKCQRRRKLEEWPCTSRGNDLFLGTRLKCGLHESEYLFIRFFLDNSKVLCRSHHSLLTSDTLDWNNGRLLTKESMDTTGTILGRSFTGSWCLGCQLRKTRMSWCLEFQMFYLWLYHVVSSL